MICERNRRAVVLHFGNTPYGLIADKMKKDKKHLVKDKFLSCSAAADIKFDVVEEGAL